MMSRINLSREQFDRDVSSMIMQDTSNVHEVVVDKYTTSVRHHSSYMCLLSRHPMYPRLALEFEPFYFSHIYVSTIKHCHNHENFRFS